jgi:short-subunit dehydrogenase
MDEVVNKPRLALVTGGSAGIGFELARLLAEDGHDLILTGASDRVHETARALGTDVTVTPVQSDLSTPDGLQAVVDAVAGRSLDVLVLSAGIAIGGAFLDIALDRHLQLLDLNIGSAVRLCHALLPGMIAAKGGRVLFVSSLSATTPTPYESVYGPSKAFMTSFGHGLREELSGTGISLTILHPGATATEFHARAGMGATAFGDNSWKNDPALVAQQGYAALMAGETSVIGGGEATQEAGREHKRLSEEEKARRHAAMAKPSSQVRR